MSRVSFSFYNKLLTLVRFQIITIATQGMVESSSENPEPGEQRGGDRVCCSLRETKGGAGGKSPQARGSVKGSGHWQRPGVADPPDPTEANAPKHFATTMHLSKLTHTERDRSLALTDGK